MAIIINIELGNGCTLALSDDWGNDATAKDTSTFVHDMAVGYKEYSGNCNGYFCNTCPLNSIKICHGYTEDYDENFYNLINKNHPEVLL